MSPEVIPFAKTAEGGRRDGSQLDSAGEAILQLLGKAADVADQNSRQAFDTTQRLSQQLRAAEDRVAQLEAELETCREKVERAEQWLHTVYTEIADRFLKQETHQRARR
jgi:molecular chaperone GrpE (heat shock protein)